MRPVRTSLALFASAALAACAVGPNYHRPTAPTSPAFKEADGWAKAQPADLLDRGPWWTLFNDPALNDLEARVKVSNQNVAAAEAAYRESQAVVREQQANLFPTLSVTGSATRTGGGVQTQGVVNPNGASSAPGARVTTYRASADAGWAPDIWGKVRRQVENARSNAQASEGDLAAATLSAQGQLATDYLGLREADYEIGVLQASVDAYRKSFQVTQNRFNAGTAPHSDVLQAQTQLDNALADLAGEQQQRATFEHGIAILVGEAPGSFSIAPAATWNQAVPEVPAGLPSTLLQRRPDVAAAERRMAAANANIGIEEAAWFPTVNLTGAYDFASTSFGRLFNASAALWSLGASATESVFEGGLRVARVHAAKAAYDQSVAQYRETVLTALQEVENELVASRILAQQYELRREASAAADAAEQMELNRYRAGTASWLELATAQNSAYSARRSLSQTAVQRQTADVALIQALGGGWKAPNP
jgi:NodT family efflux transporter outer membrane factor (OMF) lipoprotein